MRPDSRREPSRGGAGMKHFGRRLKMESKQTARKSKANVILAKTRVSARLQAEGDYEAARRRDSKVRNFVQRADIERAAGAAAPRNKREAQGMVTAEAIGRQGEPQ